MGKRSSIKRLSSITQSASNSIDIKARKRIEQLYELTDEIVNAYDEINEKYIHQIYRKYQQLKEINKNLKDQLNRHHCTGCKCPVQPIEDDAVDDKNEQSTEEEEEEDNNDDEETKNSAVPSSTTSSVITRSRKKNPFIISDIEETQNFDGNDSRFNQNSSDDADKTSMDTNENTHKTAKNNNESEEEEEQEEQEEQEEDNEEEEEEEADEDNSMARLPLALQNVIQKKAKKNRNAKAYLLDIPRYPALCQYLRDKSTSSFDRRPTEDQIRPLIKNHLSKYLVNDSKLRKRVRDELREIHRSYMRTFMNDPHTTAPKSYIRKNKKLTVKKSPM